MSEPTTNPLEEMAKQWAAKNEAQVERAAKVLARSPDKYDWEGQKAVHETKRRNHEARYGTKDPERVEQGRAGGLASRGKPKRYSPEELAKRTARLMAYHGPDLRSYICTQGKPDRCQLEQFDGNTSYFEIRPHDPFVLWFVVDTAQGQRQEYEVLGKAPHARSWSRFVVALDKEHFILTMRNLGPEAVARTLFLIQSAVGIWHSETL